MRTHRVYEHTLVPPQRVSESGIQSREANDIDGRGAVQKVERERSG